MSDSSEVRPTAEQIATAESKRQLYRDPFNPNTEAEVMKTIKKEEAATDQKILKNTQVERGLPGNVSPKEEKVDAFGNPWEDEKSQG